MRRSENIESMDGGDVYSKVRRKLLRCRLLFFYDRNLSQRKIILLRRRQEWLLVYISQAGFYYARVMK